MSRDQQGRRRERRVVGGLKQLPWRHYRNPYKPIEVLRPEQVDKIHEASLKILEEIGIEFLDAEALSILKAAGAKVEAGSQRVRFDLNAFRRTRSHQGTQGEASSNRRIFSSSRKLLR